METLLKDIRYGIRSLLKRPWFTLIAVITLALGIGANTAIFSVVNAVLLRQLPYPEANRLVILSMNNERGVLGNSGYATFADWRERSRSFERPAAIRRWGGTLSGDREPEVIEGLRVSADYFKLLGVSPALGRDFVAAEDHPNTRFVTIISHALWQRRFNSDPQVIGKPITLSDQTFTIVGVMPANFEDFLAANYYEPADAWAPLGYEVTQNFACRTCQHLKAIGRLKSDVSLEQAQAELSTIMNVMAREHAGDYASPAISIARLHDQFVQSIRPVLYLLIGAVGLVLLIACANVANLLLARGTERAREMAIRAALGARTSRILRQMFVESLTLSLFGALAGFLLAIWSTRLLTDLSPARMLQLQPVAIDARVLVFTLATSLITGLLFGLAPAWQAAKQDLQLALKESARVSTGGRQNRVRRVLVVAQMALALVLLAGAGLLVRSFIEVLNVTPGFESRNLLTMSLQAVGTRYREDEQIRGYYKEVLDRTAALPRVEAVGFVSNLPFGGDMDQWGFHIEEKPLANPADAPSAEHYSVSPDYLRTMGITLLRGRAFTDHDGANMPLVVLINQTAAKRFWSNEDPVGKRIRLGAITDPLLTIVGVVGDVNHYGLETPADLQAYVPHAQTNDSYMHLVVRTSTDPISIAGPLRAVIRQIDPNQPTYALATMPQLIAKSLAPRRFTLMLLGVFASVALVLAAIGIYGVVSLNVGSRVNEFGIRLALGAQPRDVMRLVVGQGMALVLTGVALGLAGALAVTRLMRGLLFGVRASDPLTFASIALLLVVVALLACLIPARRATKVDPLVALRYE